MNTLSLSTRPVRVVLAVAAQFALVAAIAACSDDDRAAAPSSRVTGPAPVAFAKGSQDKGNTTTRRIAFIGQYDKLKTMRPDGTDIVQMPGSNAAEDYDPAWSPDYSKIAFVTNRSGGINNLHVVNADFTGLVNLLPGHFVLRPAFSPDGTKIAFQNASLSGAANWDIWIIDVQTRARAQLTTSSAADYGPHFAPDGRVYFTSTRDGHAEIYRMNIDGSNQTRVTFCVVDCSMAKVSPDGSRLAFESVFGRSVFATASGDMLRYQALTPATQTVAGYFNRPTWSPDGKKVAFEGFQNGTKGIYVANPDGTGMVNLTPGTLAMTPAWSW